MTVELEVIRVSAEEAAPRPGQPAQREMPFAVIEGEPLTELPRDLYIPPHALRVFLEAFEGPLDVLLYLIKRQNIDILDIPIAEITHQYVRYIDLMRELQLELAGEYLLMAAMLAEIKSRMLLPRPQNGEVEEEDPRAELIRRLQEYERYKKAAEDMDALPRLERDVFTASVELVDRPAMAVLPEVTLDALLRALNDVMQRARMFAHLHVQREPLTVRQRMSEILERLQAAPAFVDFVALFRPEEGRTGVAVSFIAVLELIKESLIEVVQSGPFAPIHIRLAGAEPDGAVAL